MCINTQMLEEEVTTKMGWRRRTNFDQWPGNGPFSNLPPWQRPGWTCHGRGYGRMTSADPQVCTRYPWLPKRWWADPKYAYQPPTSAPAPQDEIKMIEESKKALTEEKASIEQEITNLETQLNNLKSKIEAEKTATAQ
jgi:hypothetical protein